MKTRLVLQIIDTEEFVYFIADTKRIKLMRLELQRQINLETSKYKIPQSGIYNIQNLKDYVELFTQLIQQST